MTPRRHDTDPMIPQSPQDWRWAAFFASVLFWTVVITVFAGCGTTGPLVPHVDREIVEVDVPVLEPCPEWPIIAIPESPQLPIASLDSLSTDAEVVAAYAATIRILMADNSALRALFKALQPRGLQ